MKKLTMTLLAFVACLYAVAQAPNEKYIGFMKKNISLLDSAGTVADWQTAANNFERIANNEKTEWLPAYYAAYALIMKAYQLENIKEIDPACDKADAMIAQAESISPKNSEITSLKAMVLMARMRVDGGRGMTMGPQATQFCQQALQQQPLGNPRAFMQMAQMLYYTPAAFGGGKDAGIGMLGKSVAAYDSFKPESELHPNWGKGYSVMLLEQWKSGK
jgi:hypothetical protein